MKTVEKRLLDLYLRDQVVGGRFSWRLFKRTSANRDDVQSKVYGTSSNRGSGNEAAPDEESVNEKEDDNAQK